MTCAKGSGRFGSHGCSKDFVVLGLLLLEELAWGQVIFGWRTPELMQELNAQNETTLHNIGWFRSS